MKIPHPARGVTIPLGILVIVVALVWIGLRVVPAPFAPLSLPAGTLQTVALPGGLPAPVERFYRAVYGERIPVIHSAVITGRAGVRPFGAPTFQARFRFIHVAGRSYRHYIEATFFGLPIMKINESFIDGHSRFETPAGLEEGEPKTEAAANLGMWAELAQVPATLLTDPRVRWEPLDDDSAILVVPHEGKGTERFVVRFDPTTHLSTLMEAMRYQKKDSAGKTLWVTEAISWDRFSGFMAGKTGTAWWYGAARPWAMFRTESILLNADLSEYLGRTGPLAASARAPRRPPLSSPQQLPVPAYKSAAITNKTLLTIQKAINKTGYA